MVSPPIVILPMPKAMLLKFIANGKRPRIKRLQKNFCKVKFPDKGEWPNRSGEDRNLRFSYEAELLYLIGGSAAFVWFVVNRRENGNFRYLFCEYL